MSTGDRRLGSARRGMTVLGKIPSAPKPINLPSQRLESGGLDPSVEIVPRGTLSWRSAGRSPPTSHCPWENTSLSSSSPVSTGVWNGVAMAQRSSVTGNVIEHLKRPSSAGSGTHPRSALLTTSGAWSGAAKSEERLQPSRFTLTPTDFPSLGSEKNPDLRPQQTGASSGRPASADGAFRGKERRSLAGAPEFDGHGRGSLGPESYSHVADHHSDFSRTLEHCEIPLELGPNEDSLPYDGYCASPSSVCYGNMEDRDMLMQGMTGKPRVYKKKSFQGFLEHSGQPGIFGSSFCQLGPTEQCGRHESGKHMDGWVSEHIGDSVCVDMVKGASDSEIPASVSGVGMSFDSRNHRTQHTSGRHPSQHGDWGTLFHSDKHMELSKSVAEGRLCSAVAAPLGSKELNMSSGDKMCQGQVSETELLRSEGNSGQSTNKTEKPIIESIEGIGDENAYELLMLPVVSDEAIPVINESSECEKACVQGDLQVSRKLEKVSKVSGCVDIPQPEARDIVKSASISQNLVSENEANAFCPVNCNIVDLSSRQMASVADASSPNLPLQNPGKSALFWSMLSSSCVSDSAAASVSESSTTSTEKPDCVASPSSILKNRTFGSEALDKNDKGYRDASPGSVFTTIAVVDQVNNKQNCRSASNENSDPCDDKGQKLRTKNRDGEKIWRPKLPAVDAELNLKQAGDSVCTSAIEENNSSNKGSFEQSNQQVLDQYDYEGQRAKLRKTAAQRAKQRQKEEEERTKEQKAKALAKLEELNRRASVVASTVEVADSDVSSKKIESLESEMEQQSSITLGMQPESQTVDIPQTRGAFGCSRHGVENDHGKCNWEHKRPLSSREGLRLKAIEGQKNVLKDKQNGMQDASTAVPPILPILPLSSTFQALLSDPAASQQVQQQQIMKSRTKNHAFGGSHVQQRSKQYIPMLKQVSNIRDKESSSSMPIVVGDGESHDESVSSLEALLGSDASIGSNPGLNGGATASRRKRGTLSTKGKQRVERHTIVPKPSVMTERASLVSDLSSDDTSGDGSNVKVSTTGTTGRGLMSQENSSVVEVVPAQVSIQGSLALDIGKDISFGTLLEDDYAELGVKNHSHDSPNKRIQGNSCSSNFFHGDQPLPDTSVVTGRQFTREGLVFAPVQTFAIPVGIGNVKMGSDEEKIRVKSEVSTSRNSARIKRAEMERYNPKLAVKNQTRQQADHRRQTQRHARDLPLLEEQVISFHGTESHQSTESLATGSKLMIGNEISKAVRPGQSYTSRRLRNPHDSYIFKEAVFDLVNASTGKLYTKHSDEASKELPDRLHAGVADLASQSRSFHKARNGGAELPRTAAGQPLKHRSHPSELNRDEPGAQSSGCEIQSTGTLEIDIPSKETPKGIQMHRGKTRAHVPVRSAKGKSFKQHSQCAQADAELRICSGLQTECVLENDEIDNWNFQEQESNCFPHSASANIPPQQHHIDDREQSSPATGAELNQNSGLIEQDKSLTGPVYHEKNHQSPQSLQIIDQTHWVHEETNVHDSSSMLQKCSSSLGHDLKARLCMENAVSVHCVSQKGVSASQSSLQSLQRDHAKKFGSFNNHHQRKSSSSHVQWKQAASSSNEKLTPTLAPGPIHHRKQDASVLDTPESVFGQQIACQNMKSLSTKLNFASAENRKSNKQYHYQPMPQPSQAFKL